MNRRQFNALLLSAAMLSLTGGAQAKELAPGLTEEMFKTLDPVVERLVKAYNEGNWKAFYADYAKAMSALATEQSFNSLYTNMYKKQFGTIKTRKLNTQRTTMPSEMNGLIVYDVTCSKKNGVLAVNWMKEDGKWKVQQVQLQ